VNAEASSIRSQIATKEFELVRLEKMVRKGRSEGKSSFSPAISSQPSQVVMRPDPRVLQQIQDLLMELKELKTQYFRLTGVDYAQTGRNRSSKLKDNEPAPGPTSPSGSVGKKTPPAPAPMDGARSPTTPASRSLLEKKVPLLSPAADSALAVGAPSADPATLHLACPPHWQRDVQDAMNAQKKSR
jgi:hypothetical protein